MRLREYLWKNKLTLQAFAKITRYNATYLGEVVNGKRKPGRKCAELLEEVTNGYITAAELLNGIF